MKIISITIIVFLIVSAIGFDFYSKHVKKTEDDLLTWAYELSYQNDSIQTDEGYVRRYGPTYFQLKIKVDDTTEITFIRETINQHGWSPYGYTPWRLYHKNTKQQKERALEFIKSLSWIFAKQIFQKFITLVSKLTQAFFYY